MKRERNPIMAAVVFFIIYMIVCGWMIMLACSPEVFNGEEIAQAIRIIRAERTQEELLNKHQIEFLRLQALIAK